MKIILDPVGTSEELIVTKEGDTLWINGEEFDFSPLPEGATLPREAINSEWFNGPIFRENGELTLTLKFPHGGSSAPRSARFPEPIIMIEDGNVDLPDITPEVEQIEN